MVPLIRSRNLESLLSLGLSVAEKIHVKTASKRFKIQDDEIPPAEIQNRRTEY